MKPYFLILQCAASLFLSEFNSTFASDTPSTPLFLGIHEQRILNLPGLQKYSIGSTAVHALRISGDRLLIKGIDPGETDLIWFDAEGTLHARPLRVEKWEPKPAQQELLRALSPLQETEVFFNGKGALLRGEVQSAKELQLISALVQGFPESVTNETLSSENLVSDAQSRLQKLIDKNLWDVSVRIIREGRSLIARGSVDDPRLRLRMARELKNTYPSLEFELESLPDASPTVSFKVFLMELKKSKMRSLGVSWPGTQPGAFRVTPFQVQQNIALELTLQALEGEGSARILSRPELVVRAPGEAELFAGGEIPIKTVSKFGENVTWKNYGLTLKLKVTHSTEHQARLEIFTEVSHLDQQIALHQIPGIQASRMTTQVDARFGTPLFLSGLLQEIDKSQIEGLPFFQHIPILGKLFSSEDFQKERSELVAILLPSSSAPEKPLHRIQPQYRNWVSPNEEQNLRSSNEYPWNVLE